MAELLRKVWVFALMSEFETHPIAAVEAAASGCRLVVADVGGTRELAESGLARPVALEAPAEEVGAVTRGGAREARPGRAPGGDQLGRMRGGADRPLPLDP